MGGNDDMRQSIARRLGMSHKLIHCGNHCVDKNFGLSSVVLRKLFFFFNFYF